MSTTLNIRLPDQQMKEELKNIASLHNVSISKLVINFLEEKLDEEYDIKLGQIAKERRNKEKETQPIEKLFKEYGL